MAIIIPSKNIYGKENQKVLKNKIDKVQVEENVFGQQSHQEHNINLNYELNSFDEFDDFGTSENYKNVKFIKDTSLSSYGTTKYFVYFYFDTDLNEDIFLLRNTNISVSASGKENNFSFGYDNPNDIQNSSVSLKGEYDFTKQYNSKKDNDVYLVFVESEDDFTNISPLTVGTVGLFLDIGIQRLTLKSVRIYVKCLYYTDRTDNKYIEWDYMGKHFIYNYNYDNISDFENELGAKLPENYSIKVFDNFTKYTSVDVRIYADKQEKSTVSNSNSSNPEFTVESNEIINEKTVYNPSEQSVAIVYNSEKNISYLEKIKQLAETYESNTHYCYFGEEQEKKRGISTGISSSHIVFRIYNFYIYAGEKYSPENILTLGNCVLNYNGKNYNASYFEDGGDQNSILVYVPFSDSNGDGIYDVNGISLSDFRSGEKIFYFGYSENSEENPEEPTNVTKLSEYIIQKTLSKYKNGKETATVLCSISDYYMEGFSIPSISSDEKKYDFVAPILVANINTRIAFTTTSKEYAYDVFTDVKAVVNGETKYYTLKIKAGSNQSQSFNMEEGTTEFRTVRHYYDFRPTFRIGDLVVPMVFGADGVDRPMSRYNDGSDKIFVVVGTKFIYDGAVWQELTLQEKSQSV